MEPGVERPVPSRRAVRVAVLVRPLKVTGRQKVDVRPLGEKWLLPKVPKAGVPVATALNTAVAPRRALVPLRHPVPVVPDMEHVPHER